MELDNELKEYIEDKVREGMFEELKKQKMIKLQPTVFERTIGDIENFNQGLSILSDKDVSIDIKRETALQMVNFQRVLKKLESYVPQGDYIIYYEKYIKNQSLRSIARKYKIDETTVKRRLDNCIKELSIVLYPDVFIAELFN